MISSDAWIRPVRRSLRIAFALELFVEFGFMVAMLATVGTFNGGRPTTTPLLAQVYFVVGFIVTIVVLMRTRAMLDAAAGGNLRRLRQLNLPRWTRVALLFSAILPGIYLAAAAAALPPDGARQ